MKSPIVLIGAARSGTKFLRDVLGAGTGTAVVPYDVNYVWRRGTSWKADDQLDPDELTDEHKTFIRQSLNRIAGKGADEILIEKTVANTLRVPYVEAVFPEARYVHLIRDGREVTESAMRQWRAPPNWRALIRKAREMPIQNLDYMLWYARNTLVGLGRGRKGGKVWGPRYPGIDADVADKPLTEVCAVQWRRCVEQARTDLAKIPDRRVFEIRYEDLVADEAALRRLATGLELSDIEAVLAVYRSRVAGYGGMRWHQLPSQDQAIIRRALDDTLRKLGYES